MSQNGQESEEQRTERALYQHGRKVAKDARHKIQGPLINDEEYVPRDIMAALFFIHQNTIADVAQEIAETCDLSEEDEKNVTQAIDTVRGTFINQEETTDE